MEFNVGIKGHNPLTCSPLYCEVADTPEGEVLSFYEFERIRGVVYAVSAWLPEDSQTLYLRCRIENRTDSQKHMYWWSNIAVPETQRTRIIVPTDDSFLCFYNQNHYELDKTSIPHALGTDVSYPLNLAASHDFFYKIPDGNPKWIAAVEEDGCGLLQCSTDRLHGRKLFVWGSSQGGRNWNEWLSEPGQAYIEIQAGLANTQLEHIPMPARTEWSWVEAYTMLEGDAAKIHSTNWADAVGEVSRCVAEKVGDPRTLTFPADDTVTRRRIVQQGSGWGAVEELVRGESLSRYHTFPVCASDPETAGWLSLLRDGTLPVPDVSSDPASYVVGDFWAEKLKSAPDSWYKYLQLGVVLYASHHVKEAEASWEKSLTLAPSAWALRNLAMLYKNEYNCPERALDLILQARALLPECRTLAIEVAGLLTQLGRHEQWLSLYETLSDPLRETGRLRLYRALSLIALDRLDEAREIVNPDFRMSDIKEGELSISQLWFDLHRKLYAREHGAADDDAADELYPLPRSLDYRMHVVKKKA